MRVESRWEDIQPEMYCIGGFIVRLGGQGGGFGIAWFKLQLLPGTPIGGEYKTVGRGSSD
jgi:hypothetical protein